MREPSELVLKWKGSVTAGGFHPLLLTRQCPEWLLPGYLSSPLMGLGLLEDSLLLTEAHGLESTSSRERKQTGREGILSQTISAHA